MCFLPAPHQAISHAAAFWVISINFAVRRVARCPYRRFPPHRGPRWEERGWECRGAEAVPREDKPIGVPSGHQASAEAGSLAEPVEVPAVLRAWVSGGPGGSAWGMCCQPMRAV